MRRALLFVCALGCGCSHTDPPRVAFSAPSAAVDAGSPSIAPAPGPAPSLAESDFEGSFDGAKLFATMQAQGGAVTGSLFYERVGVELPLTGTLAGDALTIREMERGAPISVTTLARQPDGAWAGTWTKGNRAGPATLRLVTRAANAPVFLATRIDKMRSPGCDGEDIDGRPKKVRPITAVRAPVVLGLADRAFEHTLNDHLSSLAHAVSAKCPLGVDVTFRAPLNARGYLSVLFDTRYVSEPDVGVYAWTHTMNVSTGAVVAIDRAHIGAQEDIVDSTKLGRVLARHLLDANANCVTGPAEHPLDLLETLVLTNDGAEYCFDACSNHVHAAECAKTTFSKLAPALRSDSVFAPLWTASDR